MKNSTDIYWFKVDYNSNGLQVFIYENPIPSRNIFLTLSVSYLWYPFMQVSTLSSLKFSQ